MSESHKAVILVVEDQPSEREAMVRLLRLEQYDVLTAGNAEEALDHLEEPVDLVVSDLCMGTTNDGTDLLQRWKSKRPATPFIMVTAHADVESAVKAMKLGAEDYLIKPVNPDELSLLIVRCLENRRKDQTIHDLQRRLDERLGFEKIIGNSPAMLKLFEQARRAALTDATVLILGESGAGKELIAEAIHHNSPRKEHPFVTVNMAAVPEHLVESELFGHVKGAFTGATASRMGRFEAAHRGTLFIDEIGDFAPASQAKLLRVLENHVVTPIGSNDDRKVDVRVVAATSRKLEEMVAEEKFREDLYYRLAVITLSLPSLRERREDIPLLAHHFLAQFTKDAGKEERAIEPEVMRFFESYEWPGNVRQLRNCVASMVALSSGPKLTLDDLPSTITRPLPARHERPGDEEDDDAEADEAIDLATGKKLKDMERAAVEKVLAACDGNRTQAAKQLGISVRTLQRKLAKWGIG